MEEIDEIKMSNEAKHYLGNWEPDSPDEWDESYAYMCQYKQDVIDAFEAGLKTSTNKEWHCIDNCDYPKPGKPVLLYTSKGERLVGQLSPSFGEFEFYFANPQVMPFLGDVTHWMELPDKTN